MKVKELRERLDKFSDDAEVCFAYQSGDYHRTETATKVSLLGMEDVSFNKYSDEDEDEDENGHIAEEYDYDDESRTVVSALVLR